jgi:ACT domain-containing protein
VKNDLTNNDQNFEVFNTRDVVGTLSNLMKKVTDKECNADTVNAACNCASQITQILRLHLEVEKIKRIHRN